MVAKQLENMPRWSFYIKIALFLKIAMAVNKQYINQSIRHSLLNPKVFVSLKLRERGHVSTN